VVKLLLQQKEKPQLKLLIKPLLLRNQLPLSKNQLPKRNNPKNPLQRKLQQNQPRKEKVKLKNFDQRFMNNF
jgi:hypothetical protein